MPAEMQNSQKNAPTPVHRSKKRQVIQMYNIKKACQRKLPHSNHASASKLASSSMKKDIAVCQFNIFLG